MRKKISAIILLITVQSLVAQTEEQKEKTTFEFIAQAKMGFAKLHETGNTTLNGNVNGFDALMLVRFRNDYMLETGLGYYQFNGNRTILGNTSTLKNSYLQIPLSFRSNHSIFKNDIGNQNILFSIGAGLYGRGLIKQEIESESGTSNDKNIGWNLGYSGRIGINFIASDNFRMGIGLESQNDFTKIKKNNIEQKVDNSRMLYFAIGIQL